MLQILSLSIPYQYFNQASDVILLFPVPLTFKCALSSSFAMEIASASFFCASSSILILHEKPAFSSSLAVADRVRVGGSESKIRRYT